MKAKQEVSAVTPASLQGVRIARIATVPFFVVTQLKQQIESLAASGARVTVVTSYGPELAALTALPDVNCVPVAIPRSIAPWRDLLALVRLWMFFRKEQIDIAHSTTPKAGLLTAIAASMAGVPIRLHTFTGQPWVGMRGIKHWLARGSDWLIGRLNTRCYADSVSQRQFLVEQGVLDAQQLFVIGAGSLAGVDINRFDRERFPADQQHALLQSLRIPADVEVLLFVGRITIEKGVRELLNAFVGIKAAGSRAHLVFVGPFDSDSGAGGDISPHEINAVQDTHLVGYAECPEQYMSIADILCLPSYREGFGTVVIEAAAMSVPTIGTNIYGLSDAIEDGKTGVLVIPQDSNSLRKGLAMLLADKALRIKMGMFARQRAEEMFAADRVNALVIEEYRCQLKRSGLQ
ncbi:MAG: glycosyltransferase family 4 protein [Spirochaetales bacterium]|jgi:glycosyltransferase involved in cell wall biosynthesis|nr:glycosyltransferase family 4 protein [Spirochaetales bacterium]